MTVAKVWASIDERVNVIDTVFIPHRRLDDAINGVVECISRSLGALEPANTILVGATGTGKTTVCNSVLQEYPRHVIVEDGCELTIVPAFYCEVPKPTAIRGLASALLGSLGDPRSTKGNVAELTLRLVNMLKVCRTRLIMLDEFQNLLIRSNSSKYHDEVCDWLKSLNNQTRVPIALVGQPECEAVVNAHAQLNRRFQRRFRLADLEFGVSPQKGEFRLFAEAMSVAIVNECELKGFPDFCDKLSSLALYAATGGSPSYAVAVMKEGVRVGLEEGREKISLQDIAKAFDRGVCTGATLCKKKNPFRLSEEDIVASIQRRPIKYAA